MGDFKMYFQALTGTLPREHFITAEGAKQSNPASASE